MNSMPISRRRGLAGLAAAGALLPVFAPARANCTPAERLAILTIAGLIGTPNRGAQDPQRDRFFQHNNISFQSAHIYDAAELQTLPQEGVSANVYGIDVQAKGPRLHDILAKANPLPAAKFARLFALDGYGAEIALADIQKQQWILAMETNGKPLAIGDFGPLFSMRQLGPGEKKTDEEEMKWVHSLYYIELAA